MFIAMTLDSLGVSPEQQAAVEKIQGDLFAKMEPAHVAEQKVLNVLADGIAAGKINSAKVDAAIGAVKVASAGLHKASVESLNQLHAALTPEQRATLVDKVEAHWDVWKTANTQEEKPGDAAHPEHLDLLAKDLNLAPDQVEKIRATFAEKVKNHPLKFDPEQVETYIQEFGTAFKAEAFDAKTLQHGPFAHEHLAVWGARRMAHFYEVIDPLLTSEQRTKLSAQLKEHGAAKSGIFDADKHER
jgi:Spy/CpxP family protein refolding chaperone